MINKQEQRIEEECNISDTQTNNTQRLFLIAARLPSVLESDGTNRIIFLLHFLGAHLESYNFAPHIYV